MGTDHQPVVDDELLEISDGYGGAEARVRNDMLRMTRSMVQHRRYRRHFVRLAVCALCYLGGAGSMYVFGLGSEGADQADNQNNVITEHSADFSSAVAT